jgi:TolB protein
VLYHTLLGLALALQSPRTSGPEDETPTYRLTFVTLAYPCFSPDGRRVAFQGNLSGNYDLYYFEFGAPLPALRPLVVGPGNDITPVYSPDGSKLAFVSERDGNREVYVCDADGRQPANLTKTPANEVHPVWSSDGKRILFSSNRSNEQDDFDLYAMDADGQNVKKLTTGPDVDTYASWSPDGKQIVTRRVVDGNSEVFMLDANGENPRNLTSSPNYDGWPVWSPDGKWIAFSSGPEADPAGRSANMRVHLMRPDGTSKRVLTSPPSGSSWIYDTQPTFSADGKRVAFARYRPGMYESSDICFVEVPAQLG